jgi:hypothetical protein
VKFKIKKIKGIISIFDLFPFLFPGIELTFALNCIRLDFKSSTQRDEFNFKYGILIKEDNLLCFGHYIEITDSKKFEEFFDKYNKIIEEVII